MMDRRDAEVAESRFWIERAMGCRGSRASLGLRSCPEDNHRGTETQRAHGRTGAGAPGYRSPKAHDPPWVPRQRNHRGHREPKGKTTLRWGARAPLEGAAETRSRPPRQLGGLRSPLTVSAGTFGATHPQPTSARHTHALGPAHTTRDSASSASLRSTPSRVQGHAAPTSRTVAIKVHVLQTTPCCVRIATRVDHASSRSVSSVVRLGAARRCV